MLRRLAIFALAATVLGCAESPLQTAAAPPAAGGKPVMEGHSTLTLAGGCFWCLEPLFEQVKGVTDVEVGYAGGKTVTTTYEDVCSGDTGHAEAFKITFDPKQISEENLLKIFFTIHDPTTLNRQGPDSGTQYRSAVFYRTDAEKALAEKVIAEINREKIWDDPIVTTLEPLKNYSRAEEYHQDYYKKFEKAAPAQQATMNAGYCKVIISPKVRKFREKFAHLLKS